MSDTGADPLNSTVTLNVTNLTRKASVYASLSGPVLVSWLSAVIVLICFGTALYMILLGALYTKRQRQRAAGILILHSVLIEMYLCIVNFSIFVGTTIYAQKYTAVSRNFCNHTQFIYWSAFVTWNWSSLLLSVNRFVGMVFPHIYRKWTTKTAIVLSLMFPWLIGIMMSTLFYSGTVGSFDVMPPLGFCGLRLKYKWSLNMVNITGVSIPNALAGALYLALCGKMAWHKIRKKIDPMFAESQRAASATDRVVERRFTTAKMLLASILLYMACFLPGLLTAEFNPRKFFSDPIMQLWLRTLFYTGCTLNPVRFSQKNGSAKKNSYHFSACEVTTFGWKSCCRVALQTRFSSHICPRNNLEDIHYFSLY